MNKQELQKFVAEKVYELYKKNEDIGDKVVLPSVIAQVAVHATLQTLEKLGVLVLPNN